jgi:sec-independent protein translocase protein TatC
MTEEEDVPKKEMGFLDHLEELRWVLVRSISAVAIAASASFFFYSFIFDKIILAPKSPDFFTNRLMCSLSKMLDSPSICINSKPFQIINIEMAGQFNTHVLITIYSGLILAFPFFIYQLWKFISPALYIQERKKARNAVIVISLLFFVGVVFGYYFIIPFSVDFLGTYSVSDQILNQINLTSYISLVSSLTFATGVVFELPVLVFFLTKLKVLTPAFLKKYRRHAFVVILIIAAIISPPDVLSMTLIAIPLWLLFEISIIVSSRIFRKISKTA